MQKIWIMGLLFATFLCQSNMAAPVIAFTDQRNTGSQAFGQNLSMNFDVNSGKQAVVTALGYFDHNLDGVIGSTTIHVSIFDRFSLSELIRVSFNSSDSGTLEAGTPNRFKNLVSPFVLAEGNYIINAIGFDSSNLNGNITTGGFPAPVVNDGGGILNFVSPFVSLHAGTLGTFPTSFFSSTAGFAFGAGTFKFDATGPIPEPGTLFSLFLGMLCFSFLGRRQTNKRF